jgi:hypothetical protein
MDEAEGGDVAMGQLVQQPDRSRKSHLTTAQFAILNDACISVTEAFDSHPYLVGSATERPDYRDVDLRLILMDEEFDRLFDGRVLLWSLMCLTIGQYLCSITGLPIDFQIQRMTEANEKHPTTHRNPMGMRARPLAGGGDATPW